METTSVSLGVIRECKDGPWKTAVLLLRNHNHITKAMLLDGTALDDVWDYEIRYHQGCFLIEKEV